MSEMVWTLTPRRPFLVLAPALVTLEVAERTSFLGAVGLSVFEKLTMLVPCIGAVRRGLRRRDVAFAMVFVWMLGSWQGRYSR